MAAQKNAKPNRRGFIATLGGTIGSLMWLGVGEARKPKAKVKDFLKTIEFEKYRHAKPVRSQKLTHRRSEVFFTGETNPLFRLNGSGITIWENCDGKKTVEEISRHVHDAFTVSLEKAREDCISFLLYLKKARFIEM